MKIRTGFVSNSSSSSFIVALPKLPINVDDMAEILFGQDWDHLDWDKDNSAYATAARVYSDIHFRRLEKGKIDDYYFSYDMWAPIEHMPEELKTFWEDNKLLVKKIKKLEKLYDELWGERDTTPYKEDDEEIDKLLDKNRKKSEKLYRELGLKLKEVFIALSPDAYFLKVEYSDNEAEGQLEHGEIFSKYPYIQFSH